MMKDEMKRHRQMMSMMRGPQRGEGMMMGPMTVSQAQQTDNATAATPHLHHH